MKRPKIEEDKEYIKDCCGIPIGGRFCESFGCKSMLELIEYIEDLERLIISIDPANDRFRPS